MQKKLKIEPGTVIAVPVKDYYVIGLITRMHKRTIILCEFFFPTKDLNIDINLINQYPKNKHAYKTGTLGFKNHGWQIIDKIPNWDAKDWPIPVLFRHTEPFTPHLVYYNDNLEEINSVETTIENKNKYLPDHLKGVVSLQTTLERLFPNC